MNRVWSEWPISECGESLKHLPQSLLRLQPHPYVSLGAQYGSNIDPYCLRDGVVSRLLRAQEALKDKESDLCLGIFDAFRPISVQAFMVEYTIKKECKLRGFDNNDINFRKDIERISSIVSRFWAPPSLDPNCPPPHSTGGAVDLTLVSNNYGQLDLGSQIDEINKKSEPNYYCDLADKESEAYLWHKRRNLLADVMRLQGFVQHPNEWWHFSFGDQMWAWKNNKKKAIYGEWTLEVSSLINS